MKLNTNIILKVIRENPQVLQLDTDEIQILFNKECYKKLERIRNLLYDINIGERQCLDAIYKVLSE